MWLAASCVSASFYISVQRWEFLSSVCLKKLIIVLGFTINFIKQTSWARSCFKAELALFKMLMQFWIPTYGTEPPSSTVTSALHLSRCGECFSKQFINTSSRHGVMLAFIWNNVIMNLIKIKVQYSLSFSRCFVFQQLLRQIWVLSCSILCSQARC